MIREVSCQRPPPHLLSQWSQGIVQSLTELPQVGQTAGPDALVWVLGSLQEDAQQRTAEVGCQIP